MPKVSFPESNVVPLGSRSAAALVAPMDDAPLDLVSIASSPRSDILQAAEVMKAAMVAQRSIYPQLIGRLHKDCWAVIAMVAHILLFAMDLWSVRSTIQSAFIELQRYGLARLRHDRHIAARAKQAVP